MPNKVTLDEAFQQKIEALCRQQNFNAGATVREVKRALPKQPITLNNNQRRTVNSFLNILARTS